MQDALCQSVARALIEDPFYRAVTARAVDEGERVRLLSRYIAASMAESQVIGVVEHESDLGAAIWQVPGVAPDAVAEAATLAKKAAFLESIGPEGLATFDRICTGMARQTPEGLGPAWYLSILGTKPEAQGQGVGSRLLARTLAKADAVRAVTYLETFSAASMPFYARLGFTEVAALHESVMDRPYWLMVRPAR